MPVIPSVFPHHGESVPAIVPAYLTEAREAAGLSRELVAVDRGVSAAAVASWERGTNCPPGWQLVALAHLYRVSVESLTTARDDMAGAL